ncbi:hypothetical protein BJ508DRAFT_128848 [Ascobolus immersus RN42]|uniref:Uncharacterized protein n=1 Tax=Ascobolus immersus RN42 TaxID=1160509 RepID=A0A3N4I885_ASCIM|nr:hypothetical protein BJ508DRAFT_128848 [Ascobolus immersus RN42]
MQLPELVGKKERYLALSRQRAPTTQTRQVADFTALPLVAHVSPNSTVQIVQRSLTQPVQIRLVGYRRLINLGDLLDGYWRKMFNHHTYDSTKPRIPLLQWSRLPWARGHPTTETKHSLRNPFLLYSPKERGRNQRRQPILNCSVNCKSGLMQNCTPDFRFATRDGVDLIGTLFTPWSG